MKKNVFFAIVKHRFYEDVDVWHLWRYEDFESKEDLKACLDRSGMIIKSNKIWTEEEFEALNF